MDTVSVMVTRNTEMIKAACTRDLFCAKCRGSLDFRTATNVQGKFEDVCFDFCLCGNCHAAVEPAAQKLTEAVLIVA